MSTIERNSELLFIYDAKMTNPNGDMDNENKPRMDYDTDTNLVSDVRLKRYVRDYFETVLGEEIFVTSKAKDAKDRGTQLKKQDKKHADLIDCRLFGAVFAESGANTHLTGPVQFNWGYSLNKVELNESNTITSSFHGGEGVGKDYRVRYSFLAFSGGVNAKTAQHTGLSEDDMKLFDTAMVKAIPANRTRSKTGQTPRLYLRVEVDSDDLVLKDLREYIGLQCLTDDPFKVRGIDEVKLDITRLHNYLLQYEKRIKHIHLWLDDQLQVEGLEQFQEDWNGKIKPLTPNA